MARIRFFPKKSELNAIDKANKQFHEKYGVIKWDIIVNIILLAAFLWVRELKVLAIMVFAQVYVFSYFSFHYRGLSLAIGIMLFSLVPFWLSRLLNEFEISNAIYFMGWAIFAYGCFWIIIAIKNYRYYLEALKPEMCKCCNTRNREFVTHMGRRMCQDCFKKEAFELTEYHGVKVYKWDYDVLNFFEQQIGKEIPYLTDYHDLNPDADYSDLFGYSVEKNTLIILSLPNQGVKEIPGPIGLLIHLKVLNFENNKIVDVPLAIEQLVMLRYLNLKGNLLDFISDELDFVFQHFKKSKCNFIL